MKILLIATSFNSFTQRAFTDLEQAGHKVSVELAVSPKHMREAVGLFRPDVILCPFLKEAVPEDIWRNHLTIILHPGIVGDRGPSSLDWAILDGVEHWGVTALEASAEMDAGDIWATKSFEMPRASKSFVYRRCVVEAGMKCIFEVLSKLSALLALAGKIESRTPGGGSSYRPCDTKQRIALVRGACPDEAASFLPVPLDYDNLDVKGRLRPVVKQEDRRVDWQRDDSATILRKIRASDGFPGVRDTIEEIECFMFDAHPEDELGCDTTAKPGAIIATRHGAICRKTINGAVWIGHLKRVSNGSTKFIKLPATMVLPPEALSNIPDVPLPDLYEGGAGTFRDIWYTERDSVGFLHWDFYNGAMSTEQCQRLRRAIVAARSRDTKVLVFMGGDSFWSNGIHLNLIEAAPDPAIESWNNINAINDVVEAILETRDRLTLAVFGANAGAGGVMMALAADGVMARQGVVLNPHYKSMGLHGSEYWTYSLPRRVGVEKARELTEACLPINAEAAAKIGLVDVVIRPEAGAFEDQVEFSARTLLADDQFSTLLAGKRRDYMRAEAKMPLSLYRHGELMEMRQNFFGDKTYHAARRNFVFKIATEKTPQHLARHRQVFRPTVIRGGNAARLELRSRLAAGKLASR